MQARDQLANARRSRSHRPNPRGPSRLPGMLEHLLFAVTLAAMGYLWVVGPLLARAA